MKLKIIKRLDIPGSYGYRAYLPAPPGKRPKDKPAPVRAAGRELVFTALVSEECINLSFEGFRMRESRRGPHRRGSLHCLCEVLRLKGYKLPLSVTLKIEPVNLPTAQNRDK